MKESSVIVIVAVSDPLPNGVKVTVIVQLVPAATVPTQLSVSPKLLAPVPEITIEATFKVIDWLLVTETVLAALDFLLTIFPKLRLVGLIVTGAILVTDKGTVSGLFGSLLTRTIVADSTPTVEGVAVTAMIQL